MSCVSSRFGGSSPGSRPLGSWTSPGPLPVPPRRHPQPSAGPAAARTRNAAPPSLRWVHLPLPAITSSFNRRLTSNPTCLVQVLHIPGNSQEVCRPPCQQHTNCRPCTPSQRSSRGWPWSSSGSTVTIPCMEDHCQARRTTTGSNKG